MDAFTGALALYSMIITFVAVYLWVNSRYQNSAFSGGSIKDNLKQVADDNDIDIDPEDSSEDIISEDNTGEQYEVADEQGAAASEGDNYTVNNAYRPDSNRGLDYVKLFMSAIEKIDSSNVIAVRYTEELDSQAGDGYFSLSTDSVPVENFLDVASRFMPTPHTDPRLDSYHDIVKTQESNKSTSYTVLDVSVDESTGDRNWVYVITDDEDVAKYVSHVLSGFNSRLAISGNRAQQEIKGYFKNYMKGAV